MKRYYDFYTGKERHSDASDDRTKLFGEVYNKPVRRSTDEIKAKYGHKTVGVRFFSLFLATEGEDLIYNVCLSLRFPPLI